MVLACSRRLQQGEDGMETRLIAKPPDEILGADGSPLARSTLLHQLERLLESRHFRNSKRYPAFLRYVVEHTLSGDTDGLKERTLGIEVFARPSNYDTNADPIVRVTAGEVRKRIAQYYQEPGHEHEVRIDLPLGAYVPSFFSGSGPALVVEDIVSDLAASSPEFQEPVVTVPLLLPSMAEPPAAQESVAVARKTRFLWMSVLGALLLASALGLAAWRLLRAHKAEAGLDAIWSPVLISPEPVLNVIGVHTLDSLGNEMQPASHAGGAGEPSDMLSAMVRSDMVPISDIVSNRRVTDLLTRRAHPYTLMGSADATLEQVRAGPLVLVGGLDNIWTLRLTSKLRFHFYAVTQSQSSIVDSQHPEMHWTFDNLQRPLGSTEDYAIVASYFDTTIERPVIVVAGIGKAGTLVASEFVTSDQAIRSWMDQVHLSGKPNMELVLATQILDGMAGPPRVVASTIW